MNESLSAGPAHAAVDLVQQRCLHAESIFAGCERCFAVCPSGAIEPGKPPALNTDACTGCLACVVTCPADAYAARDSVPQLLNDATRMAGKTIELACEKATRLDLGSPDASVAIQVRGCLAGLGASGFSALFELGVAGVIVRSEHCNTCAWGALFERMCQQIRAAIQLVAAWENRPNLRLVLPSNVGPGGLDILSADTLMPVSRPAWPVHNRRLSRRDLLRLAAPKREAPLTRDLEAERVPDGRRLGRDRLRLKHLLTRWQPPTRASIPLPQELAFTTLAVSDACTACWTCMRACPTGALSQQILSDGKTERFILTFQPLDCIGCGLCAPVCLSKAITLKKADSLEEVLVQRQTVVATGPLTRCARCNVQFAARPGVRLCPTCEMRRKDSFSYLVPGQGN